MERARELRLDLQLLPPWYDVDDLESLRWLSDELFGPKGRRTPANLTPYYAPHTRAYLRSLIDKRGARRLGLDLSPAGAR